MSDATDQPLLEIDDLTVTYRTRGGEITAVRGASATVARGQLTAIVGESGSGKSTTAMAATGLLAPNATIAGGAIRLEGRDVTRLPEKQWRALRGPVVGLIPQDPNNSLNPVRTIGDSVGEALALHTDLSRRQRLERVVELLGEVGIDDPKRRAAQYPHELSGGMKQRALIAGAVALDPALLIADEATSALDVTVQRTILDLLDRMRERLGVGILFITHDLAVAGDRADRIAVMHEGRVVESGVAQRVLTDPEDDYSRRLLADAPSLAVDRPAKGTPPEAEGEPLLKVSGLEQRFGDFQALGGVSLEVPRGHTHAVVGESGSGKSTLARAVAGFRRPTAGSVQIGDTEVTGLDRAGLRSLRGRVQLVYQNPYSSLDPRQRIGHIVAEPLRNLKGLGKREALARAGEALEQVALDPALASRRPGELSGGQRQRVAIARAIVVEPELIVFDEAVSALDVTVQAQILKLLGRLNRELGLTSLFISHDLAVVRDIADSVTVMHRGQAVEQGLVDRVFGHPSSPHTSLLLEAIPGARYRSGGLNLGL